MSDETPRGGFTWQQVKRLRELRKEYDNRPGKDRSSEDPTDQERNRWGFIKWLNENKVTDIRFPQEPLPPPNVMSAQEFADRRRRRGPYKK